MNFRIDYPSPTYLDLIMRLNTGVKIAHTYQISEDWSLVDGLLAAYSIHDTYHPGRVGLQIRVHWIQREVQRSMSIIA